MGPSTKFSLVTSLHSSSIGSGAARRSVVFPLVPRRNHYSQASRAMQSQVRLYPLEGSSVQEFTEFSLAASHPLLFNLHPSFQSFGDRQFHPSALLQYRHSVHCNKRQDGVNGHQILTTEFCSTNAANSGNCANGKKDRLQMFISCPTKGYVGT